MEQFLTCEQGDSVFQKLMAAPVTAARKRIRRAKPTAAEQFAQPTDSLADMWRKSPKGKRAKPSPLAEKIPTYADWLRGKCKLKGDEIKREVARAKAEWAVRNSHPFLAAVISLEWHASERTRRAVAAYVNSRTQQFAEAA